MVKEIKEDGFIQLCDCGAENYFYFKDLELAIENKKMIKLGLCPKCKSNYEFLLANGGKLTEYSQKVLQIFAAVATK